MSITAQQVTKVYGTQRALHDVSFSISKGEVVGFLGPNGAGKSTMMKIITCYIPPTSGSVSVCGFDVREQSIDARRCIGYLPEHNPLYTDMYVREYLTFVGKIYKLKNVAQRVEEMIEMVGLGVEAHKKIETLSKGYRQRVGIAQSMIHDPKVLILDEPTSGLDPNQLAEIRDLIIRIGKEKTVMLSTHIMQEVEAICDRAIIISKGNIVADSSTSELSHLTASGSYEIMVEFSGEINTQVLKKLSGVSSIEPAGNHTWLIKTNTSKDIRKDIADLATSQGLSVLTLTRKEQKLEDIFKELTTAQPSSTPVE
ncbi:MAG: gliding motility-associated ABC transporter ATP-binding subunit GldA [Flavobacteriales bacterium]|nr:gliding motility-associated ABC transporter ATP-binding subunit GldA [Flavobacteriales bacterium]